MRACRAVISPVVSGAPSLSSSMLIILYTNMNQCVPTHTHSLYTFKVHTLYGFYVRGKVHTKDTRADSDYDSHTGLRQHSVSDTLTHKRESNSKRTHDAPGTHGRTHQRQGAQIAPHTFGFALHKISFSRHQVFKHLVTPGDASSGRGGKG